jgi:HK97 family phage portal protein
MSLFAEKFKQRRSTGTQYQFVGGALVPIADNQQNYIKNGYGVNDIIYSIINLILDKVRIAPWQVYEVTDESSLKLLHGIQSRKTFGGEDARRSRDLAIKAFKPAKNPGKWGEVLKYPNAEETFQDLIAAGAGFKMLTGNRFLWANILSGGANTGLPHELHIMPSQFVSILAQGKFPIRKVGYQMTSISAQNYTVEEVLHEKYYNYDYTVSGNHLVGMAPLKAALRLTNRNNSALEASTAKFQNGGVQSIIYVDDQRLMGDDADAQARALKKGLIDEWTGPETWGKVVASGYKVGSVNLGLSPVELAIIDAEKWDMRRFCNIFGGVPSQLLNDPENKTYNNQKEGEKALTSRCALSLLTSFRDAINRQAVTYWGLDKKYIIDFDMTVFTELQEDIGEMMKWLEPMAKLTGMPPNRVLDILGLEKIAKPEFDEPWIKTEMGQPYNEWKMNDVDNGLNNPEDGEEDV